MTHFLPWQKEAFDLKPTDRFSLLSGLSYNLLHRDVFTALFLGATLYAPDPADMKSPVRLVEWLQEKEINVLHLTPALGQLLQTVPGKTLPSVLRVFFAGDTLKEHDVAMIRSSAPNARVTNVFGATETQRAVGYFEIPEEVSMRDSEAKQTIPLGRGVKDVQLLLLTPNGQRAGIGELAELYVRSPHLAAGYIADNPFTDEKNDRIYRTGELGRYLPDGNVEWVGRKDRRVNIRGFRVELPEVESILKQHPAVQNAAVVVRDREISNPENLKPKTRTRELGQYLVAYVAAEEDSQSLVDLLRSFLSERLPDYMVPSYFLFLDRLPLNPNGKVDYLALPLPSRRPFLAGSAGNCAGKRCI
jgi:acyl-coenzyme A synthetase/AMP-(fatty) acid ligase